MFRRKTCSVSVRPGSRLFKVGETNPSPGDGEDDGDDGEGGGDDDRSLNTIF